MQRNDSDATHQTSLLQEFELPYAWRNEGYAEQDVGVVGDNVESQTVQVPHYDRKLAESDGHVAGGVVILDSEVYQAWMRQRRETAGMTLKCSHMLQVDILERTLAAGVAGSDYKI